MKILIDIGHPAHVHFYNKPIEVWHDRGHDIIVTSRHKEIATDLLDALQINHHVLSSKNDGSFKGMFFELVSRDITLLKIVKKKRPDVMTGIGGIYVSHAGFLTRTPSIVFYDTENASLSNLITYPFSSLVVVPKCYNSWLPPWNLRYPGFHELSYLSPDNFVANKEIAINCGLDSERPTFLIRTVSWMASHDIDETGWSYSLLKNLVGFLEKHGKVIISAEGELPEDMQEYRYNGPPEKIHHLMAFISLFVGESATMASECAVLGVPAIYAAQTGRGYTDEQQNKYKMVINLRKLDWESIKSAIHEIFSTPSKTWTKRRNMLLADSINVADFVANLTMNYPDSVKKYKQLFLQNG